MHKPNRNRIAPLASAREAAARATKAKGNKLAILHAIALLDARVVELELCGYEAASLFLASVAHNARERLKSPVGTPFDRAREDLRKRPGAAR